MKVTPVFILLAVVLSSAFSQAQNRSDMQIVDQTLLKKITAQDSGYLQKKEGLSILSMANVVVDTANEYTKEYKEYEKHIKENDTIAKYYKKRNGNYIILIRNYLDWWFMSNVLIEFSPQGQILKKEIFPHSCCWERISCEVFNKYGDFFGLKVCECAMGGFYENDLYLFKELVPYDSLNFIPLWYYAAETGDYDSIANEHLSEECFGEIKRMDNDTLIIHYFPQKYIWDYVENGEYDIAKVIEKEPFDILYIYKDNQWRIAHKEDYKKFDNIGFDINFSFRY